MYFRSARDIANFCKGNDARHYMASIESAGCVFDSGEAGCGVGVDTACVAIAGEGDEAGHLGEF